MTNDTATTWRDLTDLLRFEDITAAWDERIPCEAKSGGHPCRNTATWRVDVHGCERKLMCTSHLRDWERRTAEVLAVGRTTCGRCLLTFSQMNRIYSAVSL